MISLNHQEKVFRHVCYFLYNDSWVLFDDQQTNGEVICEQDVLRVIPLSQIHCYYIPEHFGITHAFQVVFLPMMDAVRTTFTVLLPSEEEKRTLMETIRSASYKLAKCFTTTPLNEVPDEPNVVHQGYLVLKGIVIDYYLRVYVRLTEDYLFYYESESSYTTIGKISVAGLPSRFDRKRRIIKWTTMEGRSYCFHALNQQDFEVWRARIRKEVPRSYSTLELPKKCVLPHPPYALFTPGKLLVCESS